MKCIDKKIGRLIALHEFGALDAPDEQAVRDHLMDCEHCYSQVYSMEPFMEAFRKHRTAARRVRVAESETRKEREISWFSRIFGLWNGVPALAAVCLLIAASSWAIYTVVRGSTGINTGGNESIASKRSPFADLQIPKAPYSESNLTLRNPGRGFEDAMTAYQANDFKAAVEQLETLQELGTSNATEVDFYLGVSLLLIGRDDDSVHHLERALESSEGIRREACHYYLALAFAKVNQLQQALLEIDRAIEMNGEYQAASRALREQILKVVK